MQIHNDTDVIIRLEGVRKAFKDGVQILRGIDAQIRRAEVCSIIGPSGSGKSTLLRCIAQLVEADEGTIEVCGDALMKDGVYADKKMRQSIQHRTGLVFQNFNLFPHMSVLQNITDAPCRVLGKRADEARAEAMLMLKRIGLADKAEQYPCCLSGGQQQRVSIARALAMKPEVLLFDEPTSALDPELTGEVLEIIKGLAEAHMTMVIVTHEMAFARDTSRHIIFMAGGAVVEEGADVIANPREERTRSFLARFNAR